MQDSEPLYITPQKVGKVVFFVALGWGLFHIWSGFSGGLPELVQRAIHLGVAFLLAPMIYPVIFGGSDGQRRAGGVFIFVTGGIAGTLLLAIILEATKTYLHVSLPSLPVFAWCIIGMAIAVGLYLPAKVMAARKLIVPGDMVLQILAVVLTLYTIANWQRIMISFHIEATTIDHLVAASLLFLILELGRRVVGWVLPALVGLLIIYTLGGHYIHGMFGHPLIKINSMLSYLFIMPTTSLYGYIVGLSAVLIAILIIYGGIVIYTGCGQGFMDIALALVGKRRGGPAKVSVISSSLFGMISGSTVANVAVTGSITIPLMKRAGYDPAFAAGTEATASTGGQLVPPIMGMSAFLIAEFMGISYLSVIFAALLPTVVYYFACFLSIDLQAAKGKLAPVPSELFIPLRVALSHWQRLTPIAISLVVLIYTLLIGYPIAYGIFWALASTMIIYLLLGGRPGLFWQRSLDIIKGVENGAHTLITVAIIVALAQMMVSLIGISGLAPKLTMLIATLGEESLFLALIAGGLAALVLGMGLPTVAAYVIGVGVVLPGLVLLGLPSLVAHFFIFYYAVMAAITPPLCASVYVAAPMAGCSWISAAWWALRLGFAGLIVPMMFAYRPGLLLIGGPLDILLAFTIVIVGVAAWCFAFAGYLSRPLNMIERATFFVGGSLLIIPGIALTIAGAGICVGTYIWQRFLVR